MKQVGNKIDGDTINGDEYSKGLNLEVQNVVDNSSIGEAGKSDTDLNQL
jgi:hypothetical protein